MMHMGYFDAYNQWLYGKTESPKNHQQWIESFPNELGSLELYKKRNPLLMNVKDQYNSESNFKHLFPEAISKEKNVK